jgi:hypothetical protein
MSICRITGAEENNAENFLVIRSKSLARVYDVDNWMKNKEHSEVYQPRY